MPNVENDPASGVTAQTVRQWLVADGEIAFIDVREEGQHGMGHPLLAVNIPYSRLEASSDCACRALQRASCWSMPAMESPPRRRPVCPDSAMAICIS